MKRRDRIAKRDAEANAEAREGYQFYAGYELLRQAPHVPICISALELRQNREPEQMRDLVAAKLAGRSRNYMGKLRLRRFYYI